MEINYLIQNTSNKHLKIGYSARPVQNRLRQLQTASSEKLIVLATIRGNKHSEALLHRRFAKYRLEGEWFKNKSVIRNHFLMAGWRKRLPWLVIVSLGLAVAEKFHLL